MVERKAVIQVALPPEAARMEQHMNPCNTKTGRLPNGCDQHHDAPFLVLERRDIGVCTCSIGIQGAKGTTRKNDLTFHAGQRNGISAPVAQSTLRTFRAVVVSSRRN